jgi:hypothetical protein
VYDMQIAQSGTGTVTAVLEARIITTVVRTVHATLNACTESQIPSTGIILYASREQGNRTTNYRMIVAGCFDGSIACYQMPI